MSKTVNHYQDFRDRSTAHLFGISLDLKIDHFKSWLDELKTMYRNGVYVETCRLYIQKGHDTHQLFVDEIRSYFPKSKIDLVIDVSPRDMADIIRFTHEYNASLHELKTHDDIEFVNPENDDIIGNLGKDHATIQNKLVHHGHETHE